MAELQISRRPNGQIDWPSLRPFISDRLSAGERVVEIAARIGCTKRAVHMAVLRDKRKSSPRTPALGETKKCGNCGVSFARQSKLLTRCPPCRAESVPYF